MIATDTLKLSRLERVAERAPASGRSSPLPKSPAVAEQAPPARRLRLLVVAFQVGRHADGGVESLTQLIERYQGMDITVLTQAETAKNDRWRKAGLNVCVWPMKSKVGGGQGSRAHRLWEHVVWNCHAAWLAWSQGFDLVHVNDSHALWHVVVGLRLVGATVVFNIRDTKPSISRNEVWKWRTAFALTQAQIVLSREMRDYWRGALRIAGRVTTAIYSNVDFRRMHPQSEEQRRALRQKLGLPEGFVAGYVASFSEKKAQLRFIQGAGAGLARELPGMQVWFLGDFSPDTDPYAAACAKEAATSPLRGQMVFKGYADRMEAWYPALDVVIVATLNEGLARCMIESLACGTPVVAFDVCSSREILETGHCGLVVRQGDYEGLVAALAALHRDPEKRAAFGRRGAVLAAEKFEPTRNTARYVAVYRSLAGPGDVL